MIDADQGSELVGAGGARASGCSVVKAFERETAMVPDESRDLGFLGELSEEWCTFPGGPPPPELRIPRDLR